MRVYDTVTAMTSPMPILVPGAGGIEAETGMLHPRSAARVDVAVHGIMQDLVPELFLSGGKGSEGIASEAEDMAGHLIHAVGNTALIPPMRLETNASRTIHNFAFSMPFLEEAGLLSGRHDLAVVTDAAHMPRLLYLAGLVLPRTIGVLPVLSRYVANQYEADRERGALPASKLIFKGVKEGAGPDAVLKRDRVYEQTKGLAKKVLRRQA